MKLVCHETMKLTKSARCSVLPLDIIYFGLELRPRSVHVTDDISHITDYSGEDEDPVKEGETGKEVLEVGLWVRATANSSQGEKRPVETHCVFPEGERKQVINIPGS